MNGNGSNAGKGACKLVVRNSGKRFYRLRLSGTRSSADLDELANMVIRMANVAEVDIRAENPGSITLEARFKDKMEPQNAAAYITSRIEARFGRIA